MDFTETEVVEVQLRYGKCAYSERNDIDTEHLFIVSLKTTKKERKEKVTNYLPPGVDRRTLRPAILSTTRCTT